MDDMRIYNVEKAVENVENSGIKIRGVAGIEAGIKETDSTVEITTGRFEWTICTICCDGTVGICQCS